MIGDDRFIDAVAVAAGARGRTLRARRRSDGLLLAVKLAGRHATGSERRAFSAAASAVAAVRSTNLVPLVDQGIGGSGTPWVATPWYPGGSVADRLGGGPWSIEEAIGAASQTAMGLSALHDAGLVHGNVTPANLLFDGADLAVDGCALPGLAPELEAGKAAPFVAPEVVGAGAHSAASDVWSLGACMFAMLRGRPPWVDVARGSAVEFLLAVSTKPPAPTRRAGVPAWLDALVTSCLAVDPADRPASAADVVDLLTQAGGVSRAATLISLPALEGRPLGSNYVLTDPIGSGTTGQVWRAERRRDHLEVAVKILRPELSSEPEAIARFLRERTTLVGLTHPNVVSVLDMVAEGSTLGIVMDLAKGSDLRQILSAGGPIPAEDAVSLLGQIASGVAALHEAGLVHRDLKPENVIVEDGLVARITDFGLARAVNAATLTRTEQLVGTAEYLAPELVAGRPLTPAADVYSLGIMAYEMIAGRRPFEAEHTAALLRSHLDTVPTRPDGWPDPLWEMVDRMLAKDPAARPSAAGVAAYASELGEWLGQAGHGDAPAGLSGKARSPWAPTPSFRRAETGEAIRPLPLSSGEPARPPTPDRSDVALPSGAAAPGQVAGSDEDGPRTSGGAETSLSMSPLPAAPAAPATAGEDGRAGGGRRRRWLVPLVVLVAVVVIAGGGGILAAVLTNHSSAPVSAGGLHRRDVTASVTPEGGGRVTVTWEPLETKGFCILASTGADAEPVPANCRVPSSAGSYTLPNVPPGLRCFHATAYFEGPVPTDLPAHASIQKECVQVR